MPTITVELDEGNQSFEVQKGIRLVLALEDNGIDISHRCGGYAKCTTCRCEVQDGEPEQITKAEKEKLEAGDNLNSFRLSCQIQVKDDMRVRPLMRVKDMEWNDPGKRPEDNITPQPEWLVLSSNQ